MQGANDQDGPPGSGEPSRETGVEGVSEPLALFPLTGTVLFPRSPLLLHVFEPRYRALVADLQEKSPAQRLIGVIHVAPESPESDYEPIGTAARLAHVRPRGDGRSDITLLGAYRFEVRGEVEGRPYRTAEVQPLRRPESTAELSREEATRFDDLLRLCLAETEQPMREQMLRLLGDASAPPAARINTVCTHLDLPPRIKQALLLEDLPRRARALVEILSRRRAILDLLRPFRAHSEHPARN